MKLSPGKPLQIFVSLPLLSVLACSSALIASVPKRAEEGPAASSEPSKDAPEVVLPPAAAERMKRSKALVAANKLGEAEQELIEADRLLPDSGPILDALYRLQVREGKMEAANGTLERLIRRGKPLDDRIFVIAAQNFARAGRTADTEKQLIEWAGDRRVTGNFLAAIAIIRLAAFDYAGAEPMILKALGLDPVNEAALKALFQVYGALGHYEKAQPYFDRAVEIKPTSAQVRMLFGGSVMGLGKYVDARYQLQKLVECDPRNAAAWSNLGSAAFAAGERDTGLNALRRSIELDGHAVEAPINLATALQEEKRYADARDVLLGARKRGVDDVSILNALGVAYHLNGENEAAIAVLKESLARHRSQEPVEKLLRKIQSDVDAPGPKQAPASPPPPAPIPGHP
jgi:Tfp pilus assembly protein PilF